MILCICPFTLYLVFMSFTGCELVQKRQANACRMWPCGANYRLTISYWLTRLCLLSPSVGGAMPTITASTLALWPCTDTPVPFAVTPTRWSPRVSPYNALGNAAASQLLQHSSELQRWCRKQRPASPLHCHRRVSAALNETTARIRTLCWVRWNGRKNWISARKITVTSWPCDELTGYSIILWGKEPMSCLKTPKLAKLSPQEFLMCRVWLAVSLRELILL